jgi:hypothetical protein
MLRDLKRSCTAEDVHRSLFIGWRYSAAAVAMRWNTQDKKRQYALQAVDPANNSKNPPMTDPGANLPLADVSSEFPPCSSPGSFSRPDDIDASRRREASKRREANSARAWSPHILAPVLRILPTLARFADLSY